MTEREWKRNIASSLRDRMHALNITQTELANRSRLARSTINNYLNERSIPDIRAIINLSIALNCSIEDLIDFGERIV